MQQDNDHFILIIPASQRFLPLVRHAISTLVAEANLTPMVVFELQLAVTEACNVFEHVYREAQVERKTISVSAMFNGDKAQIAIDDCAGKKEGRNMRDRAGKRKLSTEGDLALKTARGLCGDVTLSSGMTGGLRIELTKQTG